MKEWYCADCGKLLTLEEVDDWSKNTPKCCDGYMCGCMGLPIDPPYCNKCISGYTATENNITTGDPFK